MKVRLLKNMCFSTGTAPNFRVTHRIFVDVVHKENGRVYLKPTEPYSICYVMTEEELNMLEKE